jgi:N-glycosylase/DNA lyase
MFLRDIGVTQDMAVIDAHVIRYMNVVAMWRISSNDTSNLRSYELHEAELQRYVSAWDAPIGVVDRVMWATMRAARALRIV